MREGGRERERQNHLGQTTSVGQIWATNWPLTSMSAESSWTRHVSQKQKLTDWAVPSSLHVAKSTVCLAGRANICLKIFGPLKSRIHFVWARPKPAVLHLCQKWITHPQHAGNTINEGSKRNWTEQMSMMYWKNSHFSRCKKDLSTENKGSIAGLTSS